MNRCKKSGENENNQGVLNADRISQLPEALIVNILSLLTTKEAIATSVLSKQWRSHWKMLPKLTFRSNQSYYHSRELGTFLKDVFKTLLSHKAPVLHSFHLSVVLDKCDETDTGVLIGIALSRNVRKLVLGVQCYDGKVCFRFPRCLYNCETLETLRLTSNVHIDVPSTFCLKSLRTMELITVDFKDDESFINLLSGCPNLENLEVQGILENSVKAFTIAVPSLQRLKFYNYSYFEPLAGYVINAPSLKYLDIEICGYGLEFCLIENLRKLVEAKIIVVSKIINENLLESLTSVKRLSLELPPLMVKFSTGSTFYQLVYLELHTHAEWWNLLTLMLDRSPKLQVLKLMHPMGWKESPAPGTWNQPKNVPECLLSHLETFKWIGFEWKQEEEIKVAKYILSNSKRLKRATFSSSKPITDPKKRDKMVEDLNSVVRPSSSCQLLFK
ncbi:PREDICTED: putative F-box/FBD/LRR-repeat protein At4g13965 [Camelina sativa]|uniref:F-box/FBD/LRR-repeat protein At4g13965 n=1 Tax=Camelina sativa TaxID=90675 RepID=A0ABM0TSV9_CAMSA|nr:PREDICTED: putative F-box/FBD/LRR-repeat protein At4g13965 [Camelina sativa]